jgi:hypothetical protein
MIRVTGDFLRRLAGRAVPARDEDERKRREELLAGLPYVFIIGFNKTATTTLHHFFEGNGFPSVHWDDNKLAATMLENCLHDRRVLDGYDHRYRVFSDMISQTLRLRFEANSLFRVLDTDYPGSFFIYNHRPMGPWLASRWNKPCARYGTTNVELEMKILNTDDRLAVLRRWRREREDFEREVRAYFHGRENFLEFDIGDPGAPGKISVFLGRPLDPAHWGHHRTNKGGKKSRARVEVLGPCPPLER